MLPLLIILSCIYRWLLRHYKYAQLLFILIPSYRSCSYVPAHIPVRIRTLSTFLPGTHNTSLLYSAYILNSSGLSSSHVYTQFFIAELRVPDPHNKHFHVQLTLTFSACDKSTWNLFISFNTTANRCRWGRAFSMKKKKKKNAYAWLRKVLGTRERSFFPFIRPDRCDVSTGRRRTRYEELHRG